VGILERLRGRSDESGFEALVEPHLQHLYEVAHRLAQDPARAADLAQETLLRAFRARSSYRAGAPVFPWLVTILRNLFRDQQRSAPLRREVMAGDDPIYAEQRSRTPGPALRCERRQRGQRLEELLGRLPETFALPVLLVDLQDASYEEAAVALGVPVGTVRSRLSRARALLRGWIEADPELSALLSRTGDRSEEEQT